MSTNHTTEKRRSQAHPALHGRGNKSINRYAADFRRTINEFNRINGHTLTDDESLMIESERAGRDIKRD